MNNKTTLLLALSLAATGCGDTDAPAAPGACTDFRCDGYAGAGGAAGGGGGGGQGGSGGQGGVGGVGGAPGGCLDDVECELGEVCVSSAFDGVGIPGEVVEAPGVCVTRPPLHDLRIITFTPMLFEDGEVGVRDPATDAFSTEMGVYDVTNDITTFRFAPGPVAWGQFALPYRSPPLVVPFTWEVEFYLRVGWWSSSNSARHSSFGLGRRSR